MPRIPSEPLIIEWSGFGCMWPPTTITFLPPSIQSPPTLVVNGRLILASWPEASTTLVTPLPYLVSFAGTFTVIGLVSAGGAHVSLLVSVGGGSMVSIVHVRVAGVASVLPMLSLALTEKVWVPPERLV